MCYINDITYIATKNYISISLYADYAVIYHISNDEYSLQTKLQSALNKVTLWCTNNHINLNVKKTKLCCYGSRHSVKNVQINCKLNGSQFPLTKQNTYVWVILDETLNLEPNFNAIFKKFSSKLFQFSKTCKYLPLSVHVLVYKQAILPLVEYIGYLMYLNRKHDVDKLQILQNRGLRLCYDIKDPRIISVSVLHRQANLLT